MLLMTAHACVMLRHVSRYKARHTARYVGLHKHGIAREELASPNLGKRPALLLPTRSMFAVQAAAVEAVDAVAAAAFASTQMDWSPAEKDGMNQRKVMRHVCRPVCQRSGCQH